MKNLKLIILPLLSILISCDKACETPFNQTDMWNCHHESTWDAASTRLGLLGEWELELISCGERLGIAASEPTEAISIEFKSDNTLIVKQNEVITQTSAWAVVDGDGDLFAVSAEPSVSQLYGRILFCSDTVEFNDSYIDGCDNYFSRKN